MCGIVGFVCESNTRQEQMLHAMSDLIRHRGPDEAGIWTSRSCGLGSRRLSIIDVLGGHQPMSNEDKTIWVVANGEIYNFQELRRNLIAQGHNFKTNSDTEVLIHLYEQEGLDGIPMLQGMFAYALWDVNTSALTLVRDRFGKKPLYYYKSSQGFYFASELKSLKAIGTPLEEDHEALKLYFQFGYIPDPLTPYKAVKKLEPGTWLQLDKSGNMHVNRYWELPPPRETEISQSCDEVCHELRRRFEESIRMRMISDVPIGAFLSGGTDSSLVVSEMARLSPHPVKTFSIGFEEADFNELPYARSISQHFKTDHHELIVGPDVVDLLPRLVRHFDEPFADPSAIPTYLLSEFASSQVKVVLTGDGGDELFGGYDSFVEVQQLARYNLIPECLRWSLSIAADKLPYWAYGKNFCRLISRRRTLERYFQQMFLNSYYLRHRVFRPEWIAPFTIDYLRSVFRGAILPDDVSCLSQAMYFEATAQLSGDILTKVDRMSMAASLEVRCPLLDHQLAELASSIPNHWKINGGRGKRILLKALGGTLPKQSLNRRKHGFSVPLRRWFAGPLREFINDHLTSRRFLDRGFVVAREVVAMLREHDTSRRDNSSFLWLLLALELWSSEA